MKKIKTSEIKAFREELLKKQGNKCGLCGQDLAIEDAVLDHNHKSGKLRKVLHRGCNVIEGVIANNSVRNKIDRAKLAAICQNLIQYLDTSEIEVLHPTYFTAEEKKTKAKAKAKRKRLSRAEPINYK